MKNKHNEFVIGLSVMIATLIVILGILWLGKSNFLVKGLHLKMVVQNANGLSVGDEVFFRGLNVGTVQAAAITKDGIVINLKIEKAPPLPVDSRFVIKEVSLLGEKAVEIMPGRSDKYLKIGDTVKGESAAGLSAIMNNGKTLKKRITQILMNIDSLSGPHTLIALQTLINELYQTTENLNALIQGDLKATLANLNEMSAQNKQPLRIVMDSLSHRAADISGTILHSRQFFAWLDSLADKVDRGKGTLGKVVKDDTLYNNLNHTIIHLDSLILDIKKNPKRYFRIKVL